MFDWLFLALAAIGHVSIWSMFVNRLHGVALPRWMIDGLTVLCGICLLTIPVAIAAARLDAANWNRELATTFAQGYLVGCCLFLGAAATVRCYWSLRLRDRELLLSNDTTAIPISVDAIAATGLPGVVGRLPGNEVGAPQLHVKRVVIPQLPPAHTGLRILHLSDLHLSGRIDKQFFVQLIQRANELDADLAFVTGDIVEYPAYLDWVDDVLGPLQAKLGVYFVVGNHDRRVEVPLIDRLTSFGWLHLEGNAVERTIHGSDVLLAGSALPWSGSAPVFPTRPASAKATLRVLASHTPDQFYWAAQQDVDLVLAGHTHGGQICLPGVGAIATPSRFGTRFASGLYRQGSTVMHVTRGAGSLTPFRWNCPPEVALLDLQRQ